jgi:hypothetical protein
MGKSGRLQGVPGPLGLEMPGGDGPELGIDHRQKALESSVVPLLPGTEILGNLVARNAHSAGASLSPQAPYLFYDGGPSFYARAIVASVATRPRRCA